MSTMIPKDLIPMIGKYLEPNVYQLYIRVPYHWEHKYLILAQSIESVYDKICQSESHDLLLQIFKVLGVCILTNSDLPVTAANGRNVLVQQVEDSRFYMYKWESSYKDDTMINITIKNIQKQAITTDELKMLLHGTYMKRRYGVNDSYISIVKLTSY